MSKTSSKSGRGPHDSHPPPGRGTPAGTGTNATEQQGDPRTRFTTPAASPEQHETPYPPVLSADEITANGGEGGISSSPSTLAVDQQGRSIALQVAKAYTTATGGTLGSSAQGQGPLLPPGRVRTLG
ncbi:unnamed protein product, partial [Amoebophrya sp. A25]|eukprot:GSA25T00007793001.1